MNKNILLTIFTLTGFCCVFNMSASHQQTTNDSQPNQMVTFDVTASDHDNHRLERERLFRYRVKEPKMDPNILIAHRPGSSIFAYWDQQILIKRGDIDPKTLVAHRAGSFPEQDKINMAQDKNRQNSWCSIQ